MAVDGSFLLESELRRFLDRCPKLKSVPSFGNLLEKGDKITEDEVVLAVGELVHPNYTIPLLGCFRPIAQKIVERSVHLLHLVPNLRSDDDSNAEGFDEEEFFREDENVDSPEVARVIDVDVSRRKGLRLHELACLAFCRALDLIPLILGSILNYFKVALAPAPFERIVQCTSVSKALSGGPSQLLNVVRASYCFLILEPAVFTTLWDWSCFLDIVQQSMLRNILFDLRWCSVGIVSRALRLSFKASANLNTDSEEAFKCFLRWQEFCMDVSLEKGGWHLEYSADDTGAVGRKDSSCSSMTDKIVPSNHISMQGTGYDLYYWSGGYIFWVLSKSWNPFVLTSALRKGFEMVSLAVSQRWPVFLYGPAGGGKTALFSSWPMIMVVKVDGKTLLGTYVCTEKPGEFRWQPGSLTKAVLNGFWVVFEDIDKAPSDIISILLSLLEGAITFSTGHGEAVRVNQSFRLFSTVTSSNPDAARFSEGRNSLCAVWRKIMIAPPSKQDLMNIVLQWYPELEYLALKLIGIFLSSAKELQVWFPALDMKHSPLMCAKTFVKTKEVIDVFASFSASAANRLAIMRETARLWGVIGAETLYPVNKPIIQILR